MEASSHGLTALMAIVIGSLPCDFSPTTWCACIANYPNLTSTPQSVHTWFFPDTSGQGFFIIALGLFLAWFTYDTQRPPQDVTAILGEPGHRWLTALGPYEAIPRLLDVFLSSGMIFDSAKPPVTTEQLEGASIWITWSSCEEGVHHPNIPFNWGSRAKYPARIVDDNVAACAGSPSA